MTKKILLLLGLAIATRLPAANATNPSSYTNLYGGVGVGSVSGSTYMVLTGVAEQYTEIPLTSILTGTNGTTALADTAITTGLYVANPTNLTLSAEAIFFPAETDAAIARIRVRVPKNYRSGGRLVLDLHTAVTYTANLTVTATAVQYPVGGLTNTTLVSLTGTYVGTSAPSNIAPVSFSFPVGLTVTPESVATYHVKKAGALVLQITGARYYYRPWGVIDGN